MQLLLVVVVLLFRICAAQKGGGVCSEARACAECIQMSHTCVWCMKQGSPFCADAHGTASLSCALWPVENPRGKVTIHENRPLGKDSAQKKSTQIQPQKLTLTLRTGETQTFNLMFRRVDDDRPTPSTTSDRLEHVRSEVILENSRLPEGVSISYKSLCKNGVEGTGENGHKCSNISIGDQVSFEISVTAQKCPEHGKSEVMKIKPLGFNEEVELVLNFICECQCSAAGERLSDKCSQGHGTYECGACRCNEGRVGHLCECSVDDLWGGDLDATCREVDGGDICSNNGDCVCGTCECKKRENPDEVYSGRYCECDNFNCDRSNNKLCGGHGRCECRKCICDANYTGSACDCSLDQTSCLAKNGQICNGRGTCECGVCKCTDPGFQGPTCELCPTCPGVCAEHKDCVQCRALETGEKRDTCERDCSYFTMIKVKDHSGLPQPTDQTFPLTHCKERDQNDCWFYFTYSVRNSTKEVYVVDKLGCPPPGRTARSRPLGE